MGIYGQVWGGLEVLRIICWMDEWSELPLGSCLSATHMQTWSKARELNGPNCFIWKPTFLRQCTSGVLTNFYCTLHHMQGIVEDSGTKGTCSCPWNTNNVVSGKNPADSVEWVLKCPFMPQPHDDDHYCPYILGPVKMPSKLMPVGTGTVYESPLAF